MVAHIKERHMSEFNPMYESRWPKSIGIKKVRPHAIQKGSRLFKALLFLKAHPSPSRDWKYSIKEIGENYFAKRYPPIKKQKATPRYTTNPIRRGFCIESENQALHIKRKTCAMTYGFTPSLLS